MKKVIVACGGAVATSTVAANAIRELCAAHNIPVEILQIRINEIENQLDGVDLIVTTMRVKKDFGKPYVNGMPFLSGVRVEETEQKILDVLQKLRNRGVNIDGFHFEWCTILRKLRASRYAAYRHLHRRPHLRPVCR